MNAGQYNFPKSRFRQTLCFLPDAFRISASDWPPYIRDNAIRAKLAASFLNFQCSPGFSGKGMDRHVFELPGLPDILHTTDGSLYGL